MGKIRNRIFDTKEKILFFVSLRFLWPSLSSWSGLYIYLAFWLPIVMVLWLDSPFSVVGCVQADLEGRKVELVIQKILGGMSINPVKKKTWLSFRTLTQQSWGRAISRTKDLIQQAFPHLFCGSDGRLWPLRNREWGLHSLSHVPPSSGAIPRLCRLNECTSRIRMQTAQSVGQPPKDPMHRPTERPTGRWNE